MRRAFAWTIVGIAGSAWIVGLVQVARRDLLAVALPAVILAIVGAIVWAIDSLLGPETHRDGKE